jgi:hypothetical protein
VDGGTRGLAPELAAGARAEAKAGPEGASGAALASFRPPFVSLRPGGRIAARMLFASALLGWIAVGVDIAKLRLLIVGSGEDRISHALRWAQDRTGSILEVVQVVLFVATTIVFLHWLYDARVNLRAFGVRRPRYARHWTLSAFFVPILNAFRPYQVVREIWQASDPATVDPFDWRSRPVPRLLAWWWAACLAAVVFTLLALALGATAGVNVGRLRLATWLATLGDLGAVAGAIVSRVFVERLGEAQEAKWRQVEAAAEPPGAS